MSLNFCSTSFSYHTLNFCFQLKTGAAADVVGGIVLDGVVVVCVLVVVVDVLVVVIVVVRTLQQLPNNI